MALGIVIVDADTRVKFCNEAARRIASANDGVQFAGQCLVVQGGQGDDIRTRVRRLVSTASSGLQPPGEAFEVARPSACKPYTVLVSTLWGNQLRFGWSMLNEPLAIVYIRDPDQPDETRAEILQRLYGLAPSQARLAELLAAGRSLEEAAQQLGITRVSARQYLKIVFQKTGTHRQAELVRKVLLIPPAPPGRKGEIADLMR
jgi:DNA-binding CsgD family transcriptional regulator